SAGPEDSWSDVSASLFHLIAGAALVASDTRAERCSAAEASSPPAAAWSLALVSPRFTDSDAPRLTNERPDASPPAVLPVCDSGALVTRIFDASRVPPRPEDVVCAAAAMARPRFE